MGIKIEGTSPNDVMWRVGDLNHTVTAIQYDGNWVYGRSGTYYLGTLPTGVASLTATYTRSSYEPFDGNRNPLQDGSTVYHGGTLHLTATRASYYNVNIPTADVSVDFKTTRSIEGANYVSASRRTRLFDVTAATHITSITLLYYDPDNVVQQGVVTEGGHSTFNSFCGQIASWTGEPATYWSISQSAGIIPASDSTATVYIAPTVSPKMRTANVNINEGVGKIDFSYYTDPDTHPSATITSSSSYSIWCGATASWSATAKTYYTMNSSSGSIAPSNTTAAVTISPTTSRVPRSVSYTQSNGVTSTTISYVGASGTSTTTDKSVTLSASTASIAADVWQGGAIFWKTTPAQYWATASGSLVAGTSAASIIPNPSRLMRSCTFTKNSNIDYVQVQYVEAASGESMVDEWDESGVYLYPWQGAPITFTPIASTYYTTSNATTYSAGSSAINYSPTATRRARTLITYNHNAGVSSTVFSYTNTNGTASSVTWSSATGSIASNVWRGADVTWKTTPAQYWATASGTLVASDVNTGIISPAPARLARTVTITKGYGISMTAAYTATGSGSVSSKSWGPTVSYSGSSTLITDLWQGGYITWNASVTATGTWAAFTDNYGQSVTQATRGSNSIGPGTNTITISAYLQTGKTTLTYNNSSNVSWTSTTQINNGTTKTLACANDLKANTGNTWKDKAITIKGYWYPTATNSASLGTSYSFTASLPLTNTTKANSVTLATYNKGSINHQLKAYRLYPRNVNGNPVLVMWINVSSGSNVSYTRVRITNISATGYCDSTGQPVAPEYCSLSGSELSVHNNNPYPCDLYLNGAVLTDEGNQYNFGNQYIMTISPYNIGVAELWDTDEVADDADLHAYFAGQSYKSSTASDVQW